MGKHLQKTIICLLLCAAMLISNFPAVFATGIDALTDGQAAQNEYVETKPETNVPDMSDSAKKTVTLQSGQDTDQLDSGELFSLFVEQKLYDQGIAIFGIGAQKNLNAVEQTIYDALKAKIQAVAINGGSTVFTLSEINGLKTTWTNTELGVSSIEDLSVIEEAFLSQFNMDAIISALLSDCPFDLYWYDRTNTGGVEMSFQIEQTVCDDGVQYIYDTASVTGLTFTFAVAADYMSDKNTVTSDVAKITTVRNNAAQVVADNAGKTDFEKLLAYKAYICSVVSYDWSAAEDSTTPYGNPWQLISVFDGDTSTNVVCEGYAKAFMYLCDLTTFTDDVCCYTVTGQMNSGNHMWNIVTMEGVNYLVDVTNSDSGTVGEAGGLFLAGGVGSVTEGYVVAGQSYVYDAPTLDLWGTDADSILILSDKDRQPSADDDLAEMTWHLDKTTGTLTISGTGPMRDFYDAGAPWYADHESVKSVVIEPGVTSIGASAFYGCSNLSNITIPSTVTNVGLAAFEQCSSLTDIYIPDIQTWVNIPWTLFNNPMIQNEYPKNLYVNGILVKDIVIPEGITQIGDQLFMYCNSLRSVVIPEGVNYIGINAFAECPELISITIPASLTDSGMSAFANSDNIKSVYITDFYAWMNINWADNGAYPFCGGTGNLYLNGELLTDAVIPEGITSIDAFALYRCESLRSVTIPQSVTYIGTGALSYCENLKQITIPDSVTTIDRFAFEGSGLETVVIPNGVTTINDGAFLNCQNLVSITFPDSVTVLGAYVVSQCYSLTDVKLPNSIDTISEMMFAACTSLSTITLPESITSIGDNAFSLCHELEKITIPESVTTIGSRAFEYCEKLTSLVIPKNVTSIGSNAFIRGQSLRKIYFVGNAPAISADAFGPNDGEYWECVVATAYYPVGNETWSNDVLQNYGGTITWQTWNPAESSVVLDGLGLENVKSAWIDGVEYPITVSGGHLTVYFPDTSATNLVVYSYNDSNPADIHTQYPTGMRVWRLVKNADGTYSAKYVKELDNILQYAGSSIRITGTKGIRMITSITKSNKTALTGSGLAGYKLVEYGTALCWAKDLEGGNPMVLGQNYVKSNYAYKKGVADPIFAQTKDLVQYTNVLVGFNLDQCKDDIAMRPYIILEDANGKQITIYGGTVFRSIGYIAYQNRNVFKPGTDSYEYVWEIIHHVYGDKYDPDYQG